MKCTLESVLNLVVFTAVNNVLEGYGGMFVILILRSSEWSFWALKGPFQKIWPLIWGINKWVTLGNMNCWTSQPWERTCYGCICWWLAKLKQASRNSQIYQYNIQLMFGNISSNSWIPCTGYREVLKIHNQKTGKKHPQSQEITQNDTIRNQMPRILDEVATKIVERPPVPQRLNKTITFGLLKGKGDRVETHLMPCPQRLTSESEIPPLLQWCLGHQWSYIPDTFRSWFECWKNNKRLMEEIPHQPRKCCSCLFVPLSTECSAWRVLRG